ncbi:MAG: 1-deoxy-D-xylulose-5-phosphate reductoisomerase [Muribaculaceae bacterium]|nr:1-deoxy-D-xylulose-5-phosphate reductoisomerase [Muribaculaceae bacterium]
MRQITILGSTGSIGSQTLDIIRENPDRFRASVLTAGSNWQLLGRQALEFRPDIVVIADENGYAPLKEMLKGEDISILCGSEAIAEVAAEGNSDIVLTALVGYSGLIPTLSAINAGKTIALANKETLVAGGSIVTEAARRMGVDILPVDSEHSAIFQCLQGEDPNMVRKLILTASGGPFRNWTCDQLANATTADALRHPNWSMGAKVTIDSASMMNKGFEMIEARWLFNCMPEKIEIAVHPQSIVHSMVEFEDGSVKAQLGVPDMRIPISVAIGYPERVATSHPGLTLEQYSLLTFERPDFEKFPLLGVAYKAIETGGTVPCAMNAANEVAVKAFLDGKLRFTDIPRLVTDTMENTSFVANPTLEDLIAVNAEALAKAVEWIESTPGA